TLLADYIVSCKRTIFIGKSLIMLGVFIWADMIHGSMTNKQNMFMKISQKIVTIIDMMMVPKTKGTIVEKIKESQEIWLVIYMGTENLNHSLTLKGMLYQALVLNKVIHFIITLIQNATKLNCVDATLVLNVELIIGDKN
ncbi:hypothetical protein ACJX0J_007646, partial [Zea mays]